MDNIYFKLFAKKCILVVILVALFVSCSVFLKEINKTRQRYDLSSNLLAKNMPPTLALASSVLGGFRSILVNALWIRAQNLQQEGKFFELVQLYDWITSLQPRLLHVWAFSAWNMAYNISAQLSTPQDRWLWVQNGIGVIRDKGLLHNPQSHFLLRELAWIFNHKIGGYTDDFNWYYKQRLAESMQRALGGGDVKTLIGIPESETNIDKDILEFSEKMRMKDWRGWDDFSPIESLERIENSQQEEAFLRFLGARYITKSLKMDIDYMYLLQKKYPGLDWRESNAHSLYWASRAEPLTPEDDFEFLSTQRLIYSSLLGIFRQGNITFSEKDGERYFISGPQLKIANSINRYFEELINRAWQDENIISGVRSAHNTFLREAIISFYLSKKIKDAVHFYSVIKKYYPGEDTGLPLEHFVLRQILDIRDAGRSRTLMVIYGLINESFLSLATGDRERFEGSYQVASFIWKKYQEQFGQDERTSLPALEDIKKRVIEELSGVFPEIFKNLKNQNQKALER